MYPPHTTFKLALALGAAILTAWVPLNAAADSVTYTTQTNARSGASNASAKAHAQPEQDGRVTYSTQPLDDGGFGVRYAGPVKTIGGSGKAIALVFNDQFAEDSNFSDYILVIDGSGDHVPGHWHLADKPAIVYFPVGHAGNYRVILTPGLRDRDGEVLRQRYRGTVRIR